MLMLWRKTSSSFEDVKDVTLTDVQWLSPSVQSVTGHESPQQSDSEAPTHFQGEASPSFICSHAKVSSMTDEREDKITLVSPSTSHPAPSHRCTVACRRTRRLLLQFFRRRQW